MSDVIDPEGRRLPIKVDSTSNGEFEPVPLSPRQRLANRLAQQRASDYAKRRGVSRRQFLVSACGAASTLLAFNEVHAADRQPGGRFELEPESALDPELARQRLDGDEFIFDVQGHYVNPDGDWLKHTQKGGRPFTWAPKAGCALADEPGRYSYLECLSAEQFVQDVFMDSDTDMMVLSFVPSLREAEPVTIEDAANTRQIVADLEGTHRLLIHGRVNPNQEGDMEAMDELVERWGVVAWKCYTQWGPDGRGFFLHDEDYGIPFIERARDLGVRNICVHKGLPFGRESYEHSLCTDIGIVAKRYPDVNFLVYHSGFIPGEPEGPYDPERGEGIDELCRSVTENGVGPDANVYAELGSTWRYLMRDPDSAAHALGKLFRHIGTQNVLWGTDSIWYGSPQDQIQAFRTFQIDPSLRERHDYPEITPALRAQVFGLNATRPYRISAEEVLRRARADRVQHRRTAYREDPHPHFRTYGPKSRREFLNLLRWGEA